MVLEYLLTFSLVAYLSHERFVLGIVCPSYRRYMDPNPDEIGCQLLYYFDLLCTSTRNQKAVTLTSICANAPYWSNRHFSRTDEHRHLTSVSFQMAAA